MIEKFGDWLGLAMMTLVWALFIGLAVIQTGLMVIFLHWMWLAW